MSTFADYSSITEQPGSGATRLQLARLYQRYRLAADHATRRRVLEVACGTGIGIGLLERHALRVVGGDYTAQHVQLAHAHYQHRIPFCQFDAQHLPFDQQSFDLVILFEAIYYLPNPERFAAEAYRVLDNHGTLIVGTVNCNWPEFAASPFSTRYVGIPELCGLLRNAGFSALQCFGGFPTPASGGAGLTRRIRRLAVRLGLMPRTLRGRAALKRLFYGRLAALPPELPPTDPFNIPLTVLPLDQEDRQHQILYCLAQR